MLPIDHASPTGRVTASCRVRSADAAQSWCRHQLHRDAARAAACKLPHPPHLLLGQAVHRGGAPTGVQALPARAEGRLGAQPMVECVCVRCVRHVTWPHLATAGYGSWWPESADEAAFARLRSACCVNGTRRLWAIGAEIRADAQKQCCSRRGRAFGQACVACRGTSHTVLAVMRGHMGRVGGLLETGCCARPAHRVEFHYVSRSAVTVISSSRTCQVQVQLVDQVLLPIKWSGQNSSVCRKGAHVHSHAKHRLVSRLLRTLIAHNCVSDSSGVVRLHRRPLHACGPV